MASLQASLNVLISIMSIFADTHEGVVIAVSFFIWLVTIILSFGSIFVLRHFAQLTPEEIAKLGPPRII